MKHSIAKRTIPVAFALSALGGGLTVVAYVPAASATTHTAMTSVTVSGKFVKSLSKTSFTMTSQRKDYLVRTNAMTHVKTVKLSALKQGEQITAKGPLEMHTITATAVTVGM